MVRGENPMCLTCRFSLPTTRHELSATDNDLIDKLNGIVPIERAVAYFVYRRNSPQSKLIHEMKYGGRPEIGRTLGREYARKIMSTGFFDGIDAIAPVPLNFWRHCKRGYNQSAMIARGINDITSIPTIRALHAAAHRSQTRLTADRRRDAVSSIYTARADALKGIGHVLLVDDICTTGATLYSCAKAIHDASPATKISVFVLASTSLS